MKELSLDPYPALNEYPAPFNRSLLRISHLQSYERFERTEAGLETLGAHVL